MLPLLSRAPVIVRSPAALFLSASASLGIFAVLHHWLGVHPVFTTALITVVYLPLLIWAVALTTSSILSDPDNLPHALLWAIGFTVLTVLFFAVIYSSLGITSVLEPSRVVHTLSTCIYFSATTFTTVGYGDFAPTPDARLIASIEALTGYVLLGTLTATAFFLLNHWAGHIHRRRP
jgi:hypothetical protein